ncbi:MAG: zinc-ribbon domain-containing protein [Deltaproteobacteria bacterium]|nr:zinc-ribbon domain-containing protein [Candidatus Zymogenaceae bacterium]
MIVRCPACGFTGRVPEDKDGRDKKRVVCPSCSHRFAVGLIVLPADDRPSESSPSLPQGPGAAGDKKNAVESEIAPPSRDVKKKRRRPLLRGCLIVIAALIVGVAILILIKGISGNIQESKEYNIIKKLGEKYPGYLLLNSIKTDPGTMTEIQITSYQRELTGKGCVGMGTVVDIEKTTGSAVLDFFGLTAPGTIITLSYERYDIELVLAESYSEEFRTYLIGDTVLFAGTIKKAVIAGRTRITLVDVIIEGHQKGEAGWRPPEIKKSLSRRLIELLIR